MGADRYSDRVDTFRSVPSEVLGAFRLGGGERAERLRHQTPVLARLRTLALDLRLVHHVHPRGTAVTDAEPPPPWVEYSFSVALPVILNPPPPFGFGTFVGLHSDSGYEAGFVLDPVMSTQNRIQIHRGLEISCSSFGTRQVLQCREIGRGATTHTARRAISCSASRPGF